MKNLSQSPPYFTQFEEKEDDLATSSEEEVESVSRSREEVVESGLVFGMERM